VIRRRILARARVCLRVGRNVVWQAAVRLDPSGVAGLRRFLTFCETRFVIGSSSIFPTMKTDSRSASG
jgi:hypothetical protein